MTRIRANKPIEPHPTSISDEQAQALHTDSGLSLIEPGDLFDEPVHVGSMAANATYCAQLPVSRASRFKAVRQYFYGRIRIAIVGVAEDGFRLYITDVTCPIRIFEFKKERELHAFLTEALTARV